MKIAAQIAVAMIGAQLIAMFAAPLLNWYYALIVGVMLMAGLRTGCPWHSRITILLFAAYVGENDLYLWNENTLMLGGVHLLIAFLLINQCSAKGSKAHIYLSFIAMVKVSSDAMHYYGVLFPSTYIFHATINALSIVQLVWFVNLSIERRKLIANRSKEIDPILLRLAIWETMIHYGNTGKGSPQ